MTNTPPRRFLFLTLAVACLAVLSVTVADHIPGHDPGDAVFPVPIPGEDYFTGGLLFVTALGPPGGSEIYNTSFDITYVSDGATPASDLLIQVSMFVGEDNPVLVETHVTGTDLGFGSGPGTFQGTFETSELNGIAVEGFFPPYSIIDLSISAVNGPIDGSAWFVDSFINFDVAGNVPGDVNGDGMVNVLDLLEVLNNWGPCEGCAADMNGDGVVNVLELLEVLTNWG